MLLVVDMNILFSPTYALEELNKYSDELILKSKISIGIFELHKKVLSGLVKFTPSSEYKDFRNKAELVSPDQDDVQYFALALKLKCPIWSNDKRLKEQSDVKVLSTSELIELLGS